MKNKLSKAVLLLINALFITHCFTTDPQIITKGVYSSNEITKISVSWENSEGDSLVSNTGIRAYKINSVNDFRYIANDPNNIIHGKLQAVDFEDIIEQIDRR